MTLTDDRTGFGNHTRSDMHSAGDGRRRRTTLRGLLVALVGLALLVILLALIVGGGASSSDSAKSVSGHSPAVNGAFGADAAGGTASAPLSAPAAAAPGTGTATGAGGSAALSAGTAQRAPGQPGTPQTPVDTVTKIVKTGEIDLQVPKHQVPHTIDKLIALAKLENGFVADSHSSDGADPSGSVTLRVPVQSFEATITEVRTHVDGKVLEQQTAGEDVTNKYVDLQARLHSLQATRATYERLLSHANTIGDILAVQSRISDLQTQIEELQGQLRVLNDQTTYGTLTVTVAEAGTTIKTAAVHHESGMSKAFHRSLNRFVHCIETIVGIIGPLLLVALLAGLGYLVFRVVYRRFGPSAGAGGAGSVGDERLVSEQ